MAFDAPGGAASLALLQRRRQSGDADADFEPPRAVRQIVSFGLTTGREVALEHLGHFGGESLVVDQQGDLEVQTKRTVVEIRGADGRLAVVDQQRLLMQKPGLKHGPRNRPLRRSRDHHGVDRGESRNGLQSRGGLGRQQRQTDDIHASLSENGQPAETRPPIVTRIRAPRRPLKIAAPFTERGSHT